MYKYLLLFIILICSNLFFAQRGKDGDVTVSVQEEWLNAYTYLTNDVVAGDESISVSDAAMVDGLFSTPVQPGDLILIIQMQGAEVDIETFGVEVWGGNYTTQTSWQNFGQGGTNPDWDQTEFGQVFEYNNAGNYEQLEVAEILSSNEIRFTCALSHDYTANHHVQLVRIPRINNLTLLQNSSITCPLWDGQTGGIIALEVNGDLLINETAEISTSGKGFRGGVTNNTSAFAPDASGQGFLGSFEPREGGEKGESIAGFYPEYEAVYSRYCRGAIANGGGGANYHNAGGGGGANVGVGVFTGYGVPNPGDDNEYVEAWNLENPDLLINPSSGGGRGGYSHIDENNNALTTGPTQDGWGGDFRRITGGVGGHALTYDETKVFMGGGGGAGDMNDNQGGSGGRGGGIVFLTVYGDVLGEGSIKANGENGENAEGGNPSFTGKTGDDGAGGAGGGGSIIMSHGVSLSPGIQIEAKGGDGGDQVLRLGAIAPPQADGPGGGGGGGLIRLSSNHPEVTVIGGEGGTTNSSFMTEFPHNGATGGNEGLAFFDSPFYDLQIDDVSSCGGSEEVTLTVSVLGNLPQGATIEWYESPFDETSFHTGNSYTTSVLTENTVYYIGICPGNFRVPVNVFISPEIVIDGDAIIQDESCEGMDGSITGLSVSGGYGDLTYFWNDEETTSIDLINVSGGEYELTVIDENGCEAIEGPFMVGASPGPIINTDNIIIHNESCEGNDGGIEGIEIQGNDYTIFWNGSEADDVDIDELSSGSYLLEVVDNDGCTSTAGPFEVESDGGPTIDESGLVINNASCLGGDGSISGISVEGDGIEFEWNGVSYTSADIQDLDAGEYVLVVTDENNCSASAGPFTVEMEDGPQLNDDNMVITPASCNEENGSITGIEAEGNDLSYAWNEIGFPSTELTGVGAGTYVLTITDENGCELISPPYVVPNLEGPEIDTSEMIVQDASCGANDGAITGILVSGNNITIEWNNEAVTSPDLTDLAPGSYTLVVTDEEGCIATHGPIEITGEEGPSINDDNLVVTPESCLGDDGSITGLEVEGDNLSYFWNDELSQNIDLVDIGVDTYTLRVVDENGCEAVYGPIEVTGVSPYEAWVTPDYEEIDAGESVQLEVEVESPGEVVAVTWSPNERISCTDCVNPVVDPVNTTEYTVVVQTSDGCSRELSVLIEVNALCGDIFLPSHFSPNNDGVNDFLCALGGCIDEFDLQIYSRWGELVFQTSDPKTCWDGTFKGKPLNTAVFAYQLIATLTDGTVVQKSGNVTIVR